MKEKWALGSLVITSETLTTQEITQILGLEPDRTHEKGDRMSKRNPRSALYEVAHWSRESGLGTEVPLEAHVLALLDLLEPRASTVQRLAEHCSIFFFLGFSAVYGQGGFSLDHPLLGRLAALPVEVVLDLYPPELEGWKEREQEQGAN